MLARSFFDEGRPTVSYELRNLTPCSAARTKSGREKLAVWLKHLENRSRQPVATDPMTTYDFAWLWRELKVRSTGRVYPNKAIGETPKSVSFGLITAI